jgi:hypothetical protein
MSSSFLKDRLRDILFEEINLLRSERGDRWPAMIVTALSAQKRPLGLHRARRRTSGRTDYSVRH